MLGRKSGRGLPESKTLRESRGRKEVRQGLDCAGKSDATALSSGLAIVELR